MGDNVPVYTITDTNRSTTVKLKEPQINVNLLSKIFGFFPDSIFLLSENGDVSTSVGEGGIFINLDSLLTWECHGEKAQSLDSSVSNSMKYIYQHQPPQKEFHCLAGSRGKGKQSASGRSTVWKRKGTPLVEYTVEWTKSVEILKWNDISWEKVSNLPVRLTEDTANVPAISEAVSRDAFDGKEVVLLDFDFLRILDISSTRGAVFWKNGNRKVRAASNEDYVANKLIEPITPKRKRACTSTSASTSSDNIELRLLKLEQSVNKSSDKLLLAKADAAELQLKVSRLNDTIDSIVDCFRCVICMTSLQYPLYMSPCCRIILGCHSCTLQWIEENNSCPHCRSTVGVSDLIDYPELRPLIDVLSRVRNLTQ